MRAVSEAEYRPVALRAEPVLEAAGTDAVELGEQLFAVVDLLDGSGALRRALTDPSRPAEGKAALAERLLGGRLEPRTVGLVAELVGLRWAAEGTLTEALERLAADAMLAAAQATGDLETVEDELFRLDRLLVGERRLREALTDRRADAEARARLVRELIGGKVHPVALALVLRAATTPRGRTMATTLNELVHLAARRREMLVATVTAAVAPTGAQLDRLRDVLARAYGRAPRLNVAVDPEILGGMRVQVGSEVVDSTLLGRLDDVRRRLAG